MLDSLGLVELASANNFSLTTQAGVTSNSLANTTQNGLVEITSNPGADKKTIQYSVNGEADRNESSFDGQRAVAAAGRYGLTLPTSNNKFHSQLKSLQAAQLPHDTSNHSKRPC